MKMGTVVHACHRSLREMKEDRSSGCERQRFMFRFCGTSIFLQGLHPCLGGVGSALACTVFCCLAWMEELGGRLASQSGSVIVWLLVEGQEHSQAGTNFLNPLELLSEGKRKAGQPNPDTWQLYTALAGPTKQTSVSFSGCVGSQE